MAIASCCSSYFDHEFGLQFPRTEREASRGRGRTWFDRETGEVTCVALFVAVLGASNKIFAEATATQQLEDWIASHVRAFGFYGGVAEALVPDQLKSDVTKADAHEPLINRTYQDLARHYGCVILPARPAKPREKTKVEVAVQVAERWILARMHGEIFYSLGELNRRIRQLFEDLNARPMKKLGGASRNELFERLERAELKKLRERSERNISGIGAQFTTTGAEKVRG